MTVFQDLLVVLFVGHYFLAAYMAYLALKQSRTAQGAMGWVIFFAATPFLAIPLFVVLGKSRFPAKISRRRELRGIVHRLWQERRGAELATSADMTVDQARVRTFERIAGVPLLPGNQCDLLVDGPAAFAAIYAAIDAARTYILVAFYTIRDDAVGADLRDHLAAAAARGVKVHVLFDGIGSNHLPASYVQALRARGVEMTEFNANKRLGSWFQFNFRNHRKIVVADGDVAILGGMNIGDEYLGRNPCLGHWRDTMLRVTGPVVAEIQLAFAEDWLWATNHHLHLNWAPAPGGGTTDALIIAPGPADQIESGSLYFCNMIEAARERLWIASPYFVPDTDIMTALKLAALRGVDVRILVPDIADHLLVWLAAFVYFDPVREAGVKIYRYTDGFMHQKVIVIDDDITSIGSINLDNRSCRLNFEITLIGVGNDLANAAAAMLAADFAQSELMTLSLRKQPRWRRVGAHFARLLAPVL